MTTLSKIDAIKFSEAVAFATEGHAAQGRKRAPGDPRPLIPYVSHLLGVASLVIEDGGSTDEAIAGLLHDYIEDVDWDSGEQMIAEKFGPEVAAIVRGCTGFKKEQIPGFRDRKQKYIDHLRDEATDAAIRVSLADKVHNARSTVNDLEADGAAVYDRFNSPVTDQHWWYTSLADVFDAHVEAGRDGADPARVAEFRRLVTRMLDFA